jgi:glycosyltransferase involved in cell wall biosynthesis
VNASPPRDQGVPTLDASVLIPAFNESKTVQNVVRVALEAGFEDVLVVSDGSTDDTAAKAREAGARVLELPQNGGKGAAVAAGARDLTTHYLVLLDADLVNLQASHVRQLLEPIQTGRAQTTAGLFSGGGTITDFGNRATPMWSGQRCIPRQTILNTPNLETRGYGIELAINDQINAEKLKLEYVNLRGVSQIMKEQKRGLLAGLAWRAKMYWQILSYALRGRSRKQHPR